MSEHDHVPRERDAAPQNGQFAPGVELLSKALKAVFVILASAIILMLLWFLTCGGSFIVDSTREEVIVLKFGKFHEGDVYKSGWHWFLPYPVNKIIRIPIIKQEVYSKSFMPQNSAKLYNPNAKQEDMMAPDSLAPGKDGYTLLGDKSIMHSDWKMTYRVTDSRLYFLNCMSRETLVDSDASGPDADQVSLGMASAMLKNLLDDAVIAVSASMDVQQTYFNKANYENKVKEQLIRNIEKVQMGVTLESLNMLLVSPPIQSFEAFQQLILAGAEREAVLEKARTTAVEEKNRALMESARITADAKAYKKRVVAEVKADAGYFTEISRKFRENPEATFVSLFYGTMASAVLPVKDKFILSSPADSRQVLWLKLNPEPDMKHPVPQDANNPAGGLQ